MITRSSRRPKQVSGIALDDIGWNDVGSWEAVYDLADKDHNANASKGDLVVENSRGNYVDSSKTVALVGVDNLVIVDTPGCSTGREPEFRPGRE